MSDVSSYELAPMPLHIRAPNSVKTRGVRARDRLPGTQR